MTPQTRIIRHSIESAQRRQDGERERHDNILRMKCRKCETEWDEHYSVPMHFKAFISRLKICCPKCGAAPRYIYILDKPKKDILNGAKTTSDTT